MATNKLYLGSGKPNKIYLGETEISRIYLGDTMVYDTSSNYVFKSDITQLTFPSVVISESGMPSLGKSVTITSTKDNENIEFEFSSTRNWITVYTNLLDRNSLTINCSSNNTLTYDRIGNVYLKQTESNEEMFIDVIQTGGGSISDTSLDPTTLKFGYADMNYQTLTYTPSGADVYFSNVPSWIHVQKLEPSSGQVWMYGQISVSVDYNGSSNPRVSIFNVLVNNSTYEVTVTQTAWIG